MAEAFITRRGGSGGNYEYRYYTNTAQTLSITDTTNDGFYEPDGTYVLEYEQFQNATTKYYGFAIFRFPSSGTSSYGKIVNMYSNPTTGAFYVTGGGDCSCSNGTGTARISVTYNGTGNTSYNGAKVRIRRATEEEFMWAKLG